MFARPPAPDPRPRALVIWLVVVAALILVMVMVGGITRLTESGLSITRWEPVSGAIPPLTEADWERQFDLYRATPQYQQINRGMTLEDFKAIFFWEYVHRLLGRLIGLAFAVPLLWFWWRRAIPQGFAGRLGAIFALGALQGAVGWWMVASGLVERTDVSHVRLAVHLLLALLIFAGIVWVALDLNRVAAGRPGRTRVPLLAIWALCVLFVQYLFGAYVAGLEAGYAFNSWPLMGEEIFPSETVMLEPWLRNLADNPIVVQFIHRWLAFAVGAFALVLAWRAWAARHRVESMILAATIVFQIELGILTLLSGVQIDIAVAHQGMAALLLAALLLVAHRLGEDRLERDRP